MSLRLVVVARLPGSGTTVLALPSRDAAVRSATWAPFTGDQVGVDDLGGSSPLGEDALRHLG